LHNSLRVAAFDRSTCVTGLQSRQ